MFQRTHAHLHTHTHTDRTQECLGQKRCVSCVLVIALLLLLLHTFAVHIVALGNRMGEAHAKGNPSTHVQR